MSARFSKIFWAVFSAHAAAFSVVWVGFSAPFPRPPVTFIYEGALPAEEAVDGGQEAWPREELGRFALDRFDASDFWARSRNASKPGMRR